MEKYLPQGWRISALGINITFFYIVYVLIRGEYVVTGGAESAWFWAALGYWVLALISAPWFRPPRDALAVAISVSVILGPLDVSRATHFQNGLALVRWAGIVLAATVIISAVIAMLIHEKKRINRLGTLCYRFSNEVGRGEFLFFAPAIISIFGFYPAASKAQFALIFLWMLITIVKPTELFLHLVREFREATLAERRLPQIGTIQRIDNPNLVRVTLDSPAIWKPDNLFSGCLPDGRQVNILPLFTQMQQNELVGTGLFHGVLEPKIANTSVGQVFQQEHSEKAEELINAMSGGIASALIGFIVEGSTISNARFEVASAVPLEEGTVVFVNVADEPIYYQILDAQTFEESFEQNPYGKQVVMAGQLGAYDPIKGFTKYPWLPEMNQPVFLPRSDSFPAGSIPPGEFIVGKVPGSGVSLRVSLTELIEYHSAILGVTGTGKTELALDIVCNALDQGVKVFCVDFTGEYGARLKARNPKNIGLSNKEGVNLERLLFDVETGEFKAGKEKAALKTFLDGIRKNVEKEISDFLSPPGADLALFELAEVTNSKATLSTTELYLSAIMRWARQHRKQRQILIVLEEAHTIVPETAGAGFDYDTQWVVSRIGQIALQGRKYGVGLLVISQRTALGSGLIAYSQKMTVAAMAMADMKVWAQRS